MGFIIRESPANGNNGRRTGVFSPQNQPLEQVYQPASALDGPPKFAGDGPLTPDGYGVNTMAPPYQPSYVPPPDPGLHSQRGLRFM